MGYVDQLSVLTIGALLYASAIVRCSILFLVTSQLNGPLTRIPRLFSAFPHVSPHRPLFIHNLFLAYRQSHTHTPSAHPFLSPFLFNRLYNDLQEKKGAQEV